VSVIAMQRTHGCSAIIAAARARVPSVEPSSTRMNSKVIPSGPIASPTWRTSASTFSSSLCAGATTESSIARGMPRVGSASPGGLGAASSGIGQQG
jgi:hypothetical protein